MHCFIARLNAILFFELLCNVLCYELCVEVRALNFNNVDNDRLAELLLALCAELLDFCAALTDDHTGLCAVNVNANLGGIALNFNLRNTCEVELLLQRFAEVVVLNERIAEISFLCEPAGIQSLMTPTRKPWGLTF